MNELPRYKLCEIIEQYGASVFDDARRCESLLRDLCAAYPREVNVLVGALKQRIPHDLTNSSKTLPLPVLLAQLERRLVANLALTEEASKWALYSWALALNLVTWAEIENLPAGQQKPQTEGQPTTPPPVLPPLGASRRLEEWKQRLIDLTRRNRLLYFNPAKGSTLTISAPDVEAIFEHLYEKEKNWKFWMPPTDESEPQSSTGVQSALHFKPPPIRTAPPRKDELVCSGVGRKQLEKTLKNIYRRSRTDYQERGLRIAYAAFGTLQWQEKGALDTVRSPLVLCPVELQRDTATDTYQLHWAEEDLVLNPALLAKLRSDFDLRLPSLTDDFDSRELMRLLKSVENKVRPFDWSVQATVHLSMFSFHKLGMFQDLVTNAKRIMSHPVIRGLAGEMLTNTQDERIPDECELDALQKPEDTFQILDADSSQQKAIQIALRGHSLVLQGPPGTGKSQTIANIIAEFIARGKSVLFVSEKMAALDIVFKRLREVHLDDFCLELHSHKAKKREVITHLKSALDSRLTPTQLPALSDFEKLKRTRQHLNDYVTALHEARSPLGQSVRAVLEKLALLHATPLAQCRFPGLEHLHPAQMDEWDQLIRRLQSVWYVVQEGENFPWFSCKERKFDLQRRTRWTTFLQSGNEAMSRLRTEAEHVAIEIGVEPPENVTGCVWLLQVGTHLNSSPSPDPAWLNSTELDMVFGEAEKYRKFCSGYWDARNTLAAAYEEGFFYLAPDTGPRLEHLCEQLRRQTDNKLVNDTRPACELVDQGREVLDFVVATRTLVLDVLGDVELLSKRLGLTLADVTIGRAVAAARLAILCAAQNKPEASWLEPARLREVRDLIARLRPQYAAYRDLRAAFTKQHEQLLDLYDASILNLDLDTLIEHFSSFFYRTPLRFFHPGFYRDRRIILRASRLPTLSAGLIEDMLAAREVTRLWRRLATEEPPPQEMLGGYDRRADTNFHQIEQAIESAFEVLELVGATAELPPNLIKAISFGSLPANDLRLVGERNIKAINQWQESLIALSNLVPVERLPTTNLPMEFSSLAEIGLWAEDLQTSLAAVCELLPEALAHSKKPDTIELASLLADIRKRDQLRSMLQRMDDDSDRQRQRFGRRYKGVNTTWSEVLTAIEWTREMRGLFNGRTMTPRFAAVVTEQQPCKERIAAVNRLSLSLDNAVVHLDELEACFESPCLSSQGIPLREASFAAVREKFDTLLAGVDDLAAWTECKSIEGRFTQTGLAELLKELKLLQPAAEQLSDVFHKSLYHAWYDRICEMDTRLTDFEGHAHEEVIEDFRAIDEKLVRLAAQTIVRQCDMRRPRDVFFQSADSEVSVLRKQAMKQRGHLAIRQLFERIPNLLLQLKPCLLMSPLSVSQFLQAEQLRFDLVIFDEASQIFTEDAVGAIYRSAQVVIAGDSKQLPPTDFFRGIDADTDDEAEDESDPSIPLADSSADYASVLDECQTINGMAVQWLRWHYRSRHESLIAFSNREFYEDRLLTFPSAQDKHPALGVELVHVPDGIYDRGNKRHNLREAVEVANHVFSHFAVHPDKSLGVVAFSQAQMVAIDDEIERRRLAHPQYEAFFNDDRLEGFFVKNLENVQGDERDVIIFSVGYGRDAHGRMTMGFGPLNRPGGERRLNVAITRAREKVILVSSIRATDIKLRATSSLGVVSLQRYLDYAAQGGAACSIAYQNAAQPVSDIESDIGSELCKRGYEVARNIGTSEYRIDIAIIDPQVPGKFLLGIECDGTMYRKANTARDRDRLRQQVLGRLGWQGRLHRIWTPDWVMRRQIETRRLAEKLTDAQNKRGPGLRDQKGTSEAAEHGAPTKSEEPIDAENESSGPPPLAASIKRVDSAQDSLQILPGVTVYEVCHLPTSHLSFKEFHDPACRQEQCRLLRKIVDVEGPIHIELATQRLIDAWGKTSAGSRIKYAVNQAVIINCEQKAVFRDDDDILWPYPANHRAEIIRVPNGNDPESNREIKHIPPKELHNAMLLIVRHTIGITAESLIAETARLFGFHRTGPQIRERLMSTLTTLRRIGAVEISNSFVSLHP